MTIRAIGALLCALGFLCASSGLAMAGDTVRWIAPADKWGYAATAGKAKKKQEPGRFTATISLEDATKLKKTGKKDWRGRPIWDASNDATAMSKTKTTKKTGTPNRTIWNPVPNFDIGVEVVYSKKNKKGAGKGRTP